jgi:hypothetical protein
MKQKENGPNLYGAPLVLIMKCVGYGDDLLGIILRKRLKGGAGFSIVSSGDCPDGRVPSVPGPLPLA